MDEAIKALDFISAGTASAGNKGLSGLDALNHIG